MSSNPYRIEDVLGLLPYTRTNYADIASKGYAYPELLSRATLFSPPHRRACKDILPNVEEHMSVDGVSMVYITWYSDKEATPKWYYPFVSPAQTHIEALLAWSPEESFGVRQVRVAGYLRRDRTGWVQQYDLLSPSLDCKLLRITKAGMLRVRLSYQSKAWITEVTAGRLVTP